VEDTRGDVESVVGSLGIIVVASIFSIDWNELGIGLLFLRMLTATTRCRWGVHQLTCTAKAQSQGPLLSFLRIPLRNVFATKTIQLFFSLLWERLNTLFAQRSCHRQIRMTPWKRECCRSISQSQRAPRKCSHSALLPPR